jgi:hypothetical protein
MTSITKNKIYVSGRYVGSVEGGVFKKSIKGERHMLHSPRAIALSIESLRQAEALGAHDIEIKDTVSGIVYSCSVLHFKRFCFDLQRGGYEPQKALPLDRFNVIAGEPKGNIPMRINIAERVVLEPTHIEENFQLSFFG